MNDLQPDTSRTRESPAPAGPTWGGDPLRSTLLFLAIPATLAVVIVGLDVRLPGWALYGIAAILGMVLLARIMRDPEWLVALFIIYIPLNKIFVAPIAPGLNGTNALLLLLLFSWWLRGKREAQHDPRRRPGATVVGAYAVVTLASVITAIVTLGTEYVAGGHLGEVKAWLDQFIVFFALFALIRDGNMARRVVIYMMLGSVVVLALGFQEWLDKRTLDSIEKARVLGPQLQPNDFGAFLAYSSTPILALLLNNIWRARFWLVTVPYLVVLAKILLATFSRGAYLGMGLGGVVAGYIRGKAFLAGAVAVGIGLLVAMPELVPESLAERMSQTTSDSAGPSQELDASSQTRLILWEAALKMTLESPVFGWGFKTFPVFKGQYTSEPVHESDNHNMYLYLSSQMGIPAVLLFLLILWRMYVLGVFVYRNNPDPFTRSIGMGAAAMAGTVGLVNMFGSRMVDIAVTAYFWVMLVVVARLCMETQERLAVERDR